MGSDAAGSGRRFGTVQRGYGVCGGKIVEGRRRLLSGSVRPDYDHPAAGDQMPNDDRYVKVRGDCVGGS